MKKTRILISSVLKPVNDTRMFEKLGASLAKLPTTEVHIAGFSSPLLPNQGPKPRDEGAVYFHPFPFFKRLSWGRVKVQLAYWQLLRRLKPAIQIISTHELLVVSVLYSVVAGGKIWYDVRENYFLNLTTQNTYPRLIRYLLGYGIRFLEYVTAPFISEYLLAEKSYAAELPFTSRKYTILENKYQPRTPAIPLAGPFPKKLTPGKVKLLYSGTISEIYGIFEAIQLCTDLHRLHHGFSLTIVGYCAVAATLQHVIVAIQDKPYITLIGGDQLVPHIQIIQHIQQSDLGLLPYRPHPSTFACTPTKLFEYLANGLPVLVSENPNWTEYIHRHQAGLSVNFQSLNLTELLTQLFTQRFYLSGIPAEVFWKAEERQLLNIAKRYV